MNRNGSIFLRIKFFYIFWIEITYNLKIPQREKTIPMRVYNLTFLVSRFNLYTVLLTLNRIISGNFGFHIHLVVHWSLLFRTWNGFGLQPLSSPDQVLQLNPDSSEVLLKPISAGNLLIAKFYLPR